MMAETLRNCIRRGGRGDFAVALLALAEEPTFAKLIDAYGQADTHNQAALRRAYPQLDDLVAAYNALHWLPQPGVRALQREFAGLQRLDEEVANPHAIVLRTGDTEEEASK